MPVQSCILKLRKSLVSYGHNNRCCELDYDRNLRSYHFTWQSTMKTQNEADSRRTEWPLISSSPNSVDPLYQHAESIAGEMRDCPLLSVEQVTNAGFGVMATLVIDIERLNKVHKGGAFLGEYAGKNMTEAFRAAHLTALADRSFVHRIKPYVVGKVREGDELWLLSDDDREHRKLLLELYREGLFDGRRHLGLLFPAALLCVAVLLRLTRAYVVPFGLSVLAYLRMLWYIHDVMHHAHFATASEGERVVDRLTLWFWGFPASCSFKKHSVHHALTNVLDYDWTNLGPVAVHGRHADKGPSWFRVIQAPVWYLLVLPFGFPLSKALESVRSLSCGQVMVGACLNAMRVGMIYRSLGPLQVTAPYVALALFAYVATLNHLLEDALMYEHADAPGRATSWVRQMAEPTFSIDAGPWFTWLCGGLNYHVEHHLFPTMAHEKLPRVSARVRKLLLAHGVPYNSAALVSIATANWRKLYKPY